MAGPGWNPWCLCHLLAGDQAAPPLTEIPEHEHFPCTGRQGTGYGSQHLGPCFPMPEWNLHEGLAMANIQIMFLEKFVQAGPGKS